jgi:pilus assembly protein Flp/PilA
VATDVPMPLSFQRKDSAMLKYYINTTEALKRLRTDKDGVVSLEYVIVGACVCAVVLALFAGTGSNTLSGALNTGFGQIATTMTGLP